MGAGGLDVAVAMGGGAYYINMPKMVKINLTGRLQPWVSAKDVILEVLRRLTVKGGVGKIIEYAGEGVKTLTVPMRATITNTVSYTHLLGQKAEKVKKNKVRKRTFTYKKAP